uniref:Progestin and adipoQ receptor family member VII, a n=1 Tax=Oreochromis niloticus TaxID=8128 RepID=A0A669DGV7_ORENI
MATIVMESIGRVFISLQQIWQVPQLLTDAAPSMPSTVRDTEVPSYFRERYVCTGYRPLNQNWRYYFLSLFQRHNETLNIWTHLVAFLVLLIKLCQLTETVDFISDRHSWPLLILVLSSLTYSAFSVVAHLLGGKSDLAHYCFYFLDYVGVAQYQYGSAVVHFYYAVDESVHGLVSGIFMPTATILSCLSCLGCCYGRYCNHSLPTWICQVVCSFFFTCPLPEVCFPGCSWNRDIKMSMFIFCCPMYQTHTFELEYMSSGKLYSNLHGICVAALFVGLYTCIQIKDCHIYLHQSKSLKNALKHELHAGLVFGC